MDPTTPDEFFLGQPQSQALFEAIRQALIGIGPAEMRVTRSQIAFRRRRGFAWVWMPGQYLEGRRVALLVLTVGLRWRDASPRWKEVVEPGPGRFVHHLELHTAADIDAEVVDWLRQAWELAG